MFGTTRYSELLAVDMKLIKQQEALQGDGGVRSALLFDVPQYTPTF